MATWSPAPSRPCSEHLDPRIPAPSAIAGLPPGTHLPARRVVKIQLFMGREEGGLNLDLKAGGALARAQRRSEPEVGRAGGGLGAGSAPPSAVPPSGS